MVVGSERGGGSEREIRLEKLCGGGGGGDDDGGGGGRTICTAIACYGGYTSRARLPWRRI